MWCGLGEPGKEELDLRDDREGNGDLAKLALWGKTKTPGAPDDAGTPSAASLASGGREEEESGALEEDPVPMPLEVQGEADGAA